MTDQVDWTTWLEEPSDEDVWVNFGAKKPDYTVEGEIVRGPLGLTIRYMKIETDAPLGVSREILRSVPAGEVLAKARGLLAKHVNADAPSQTPEPAPCACGCRAHGDRLDGSRYMAMSDDFLRRVAVAYIEECASGGLSGALDRTASRFDRPVGTVRTWMKRARQAGWLSPSMQGRRAAGEPGPRLLAANAESTAEHAAPTA